MLKAQAALECQPTREVLQDTIQDLVAQLDHGKSAAFAGRIGDLARRRYTTG